MRGFAEFAVVFAMLWIAWINGSLYIELHGREDGRTRLLVFLQMGILALLAVVTEHAADSTGTQFALVYAAFLALMSWHWWSVRQLDRTERPEFLAITAWYVGGMVVSTRSSPPAGSSRTRRDSCCGRSTPRAGSPGSTWPGPGRGSGSPRASRRPSRWSSGSGCS